MKCHTDVTSQMELIGPVLDFPDAVAGSSYLRPKLNQWTYIWSILADDI